MPRIPNLRQMTATMTYANLGAMSRPAQANQPEVLVDTLYDTATFTKSSTTRLTFFAASQSDASLGNMEQGGALPAGKFFLLYYLYIDAYPSDGSWMTTGATAATGLLDDLGLLLHSSRPRLELSYNQKTYGPWPVSVFRGSGGLQGGVMATYTAPVDTEWGFNETSPDGGFSFDGSIVLAPQQGWKMTIIWPAVVATAVDYYVRVTLHGVSARPIQ